MAVETVTFSAPRAAEAIGCTFRQLDYWVRSGIVCPSVPAHGSGSRRLFTLKDVALGRAVHQLMGLGATAVAVTEAAATLAERPLDRWRGSVVVTPEGRVLEAAEAERKRTPGWLIRLDRCTRGESRNLAA